LSLPKDLKSRPLKTIAAAREEAKTVFSNGARNMKAIINDTAAAMEASNNHSRTGPEVRRDMIMKKYSH